jgi:hypothetical protein
VTQAVKDTAATHEATHAASPVDGAREDMGLHCWSRDPAQPQDSSPGQASSNFVLKAQVGQPTSRSS